MSATASTSKQSSTNSSTGSTTTGVGAEAVAATTQPPPQFVQGEARESVTVQSQLATSTVVGDVTSKSNIGQVVTDLGAAHQAHTGWVESETAKISEWGQGEITRILAQTKGMEQQLIKQAQEQQKALDASHQGELAKIVQQLDLRKAAELKELEDALQRQIQGVLTSSKNDINRIESEMNARKMELLKQSQLKSAGEIAQLSNLVVQTKLVPSQTRVVIETNTQTGNVIAVASGGTISTGAAEAQSYSQAEVAAVPNAGRLTQETDVKTGDMVRNDGRKVGEGAIVSTMTNVTEQTQGAGAAHSYNNDGNKAQQASSSSSISATAPDQAVSGVSARTSGSDVDHEQRSGATQRAGDAVPVDHNRQAGSTSGPVFHHDGQKDSYDASNKDRKIDAGYGKPSAGQQQSEGGLMNKVRNALHSGSEPKSNEATKRV